MSPEMKEYLQTSLGEEWFSLLEKDFETPWFLKLASEVSTARDKVMVYPESESVFRAFRETPPSKVKVVMLGQDPYNGPREATGIAFDCGSAYAGKRIAPSWKKVLDVYDKDYPSNFSTDLMEGRLIRWCHAGVLLINTALTVPHKSPGMHQPIWQPFISRVIDLLAWDSQPKVFVFLGNHAAAFRHIVRQPHLSFKYEHPAAACHAIPQREWDAKGIFRNINAALEQLGVEPVEW